MRYFGKDGAQCRPHEFTAASTNDLCHHLGRAVLYGRVPRSVCLWLGMAVLGVLLGLGLWALTSMQPDSGHSLRDAASAMSIRR